MPSYPLEEAEGYPQDYKMFDVVLSSNTFYQALKQALQTVNSINELILTCTFHSLKELQKILPVERIKKTWKVKTNYGLLTLHIEEGLLDCFVSFQKLADKKESNIQVTYCVVAMKYRLENEAPLSKPLLNKDFQSDHLASYFSSWAYNTPKKDQ